MNPTTKSYESMRVIRAIETRSETGVLDSWFEIGAGHRSVWISSSQLIAAEGEAFIKLAEGGLPCVAAAAKTHVKNLVQGHTHFEPGLVAAQPGWCGDFYVFGDGRIAAPRKRSSDEVIVAFTPIAKFEPRGTLADYKRAIKPVVQAQPLPMFAIFFALIPPLLRFAPADITSYPMIELVGPRGSGKSVIACLAASVWSGADRLTGGAETWDLTEGVLDKMNSRWGCQCASHFPPPCTLKDRSMKPTTGTSISALSKIRMKCRLIEGNLIAPRFRGWRPAGTSVALVSGSVGHSSRIFSIMNRW